jgi:TRAP-type mannitol/chloroaromatic compound transport system substrate-binding protein
MRKAVIGIVVGVVIGVVVGATVVAPRLVPPPVEKAAQALPLPETADQAKEKTAPKPPEKQVIRWKMASAYSASLTQLGSLAKRLEHTVWRVSDGGMEIRFHEPDALVPVDDMLEAVSSGAIDAAFASPGLWGRKLPALNLFAAVPFGPDQSEFLAWIFFGGGGDLQGEVFRKQGVHAIPCGIIAPAASGWFRKEVRLVEDLKGLKMRISGLGAKVMIKLGVEARQLNGGDIFMALEAGEIAAAEYAMPAIDLKLGFHRMAPHYYFPGWHQASTLLDLIINAGRWDALSPVEQARIETVCGDNIRHGLAEGEASQYGALKTMQANGVRFHRWPTEILDALKGAWTTVAKEETEADEDFKRVWESLRTFRRDYAIWRELSRP